MTQRPLSVDENGKVIMWEEGVEDFAKTSMKIMEALMKRVLQLERDKRSVEARLTTVEQKLGKIAMRDSD